jgi:hypothetical protein
VRFAADLLQLLAALVTAGACLVKRQDALIAVLIISSDHDECHHL